MSRLIDADKLLNNIKYPDGDDDSPRIIRVNELKTWINDQPIVDAAPITRCKDCKWWKDSDGAFRRGIGAESQCPINRIEVYEGNGYCFLFEPQESEDK